MTAVADVRRWLREVVVGLDLCPFAAGPLQAGRVRLAVSQAPDLEGSLGDLARELADLDRVPPSEIETTLLVFSHGFADFEAFLDLAAVADELIDDLGLRGVVQLATFHPAYRFADAPAGDPANWTNRAPHPVLHLLREASVERAVASHPDAGGIPDRNQALLRSMAHDVLAGVMAASRPAS